MGDKISLRVCHSRPISTFYGTLNSEMSSRHNSCRGFAYRSARWFNGALIEHILTQREVAKVVFQPGGLPADGIASLGAVFWSL